MKNIIEVKNLVKKYKDLTAVNDISFEVKEGSLFAFLGENGAGKSTTINVLCTILKKNGGEVLISNNDIDKNPDKVRQDIGIVFQNSVLDNVLTVKENLISRSAYYGLNKKQTVERINYLVCLLDLGEIINRKYSELSGGQRRRVDIARALINNPKILFLDEPTTGLDPKTRKLVWKIINNLRKELGLTVFLTTHYMEETEEADEIVIIDGGRIVASGSPNTLKSMYSSNKMLWHIEQSKECDELLKKYSFKFEYIVDTYKVKYKDTKEVIDFLINEKEKVSDIELIKGNMDDVFINVTGREMEA